MSEPTIEELEKQYQDELKKKILTNKLNDLKGAAQTQEKIEIKDTSQSEQTITKLQAAIEVRNNITKDKIFHLSSIVGLLIVFGLTKFNGLIGGIAAVLLIGLIAYRVTMIVKYEQYLKLTYKI